MSFTRVLREFDTTRASWVYLKGILVTVCGPRFVHRRSSLANVTTRNKLILPPCTTSKKMGNGSLVLLEVASAVRLLGGRLPSVGFMSDVWYVH